MYQEKVLEYLSTQRVCVVAVEMPDGSPHAATVHFAHTETPLTFIIQTSPNYRKSEALMSKENIRASLVVGTEEVEGGKDRTFQLDGIARVLKDNEKKFIEIYFRKFPEKRSKKNFSDDIFFIVTPTSWKYTLWGEPGGKMIINSEREVIRP